MASDPNRQPATAASSGSNIIRIVKEGRREDRNYSVGESLKITERLRKELRDKGLKGFKRGGPVKRTGIYKLHRGERVIPARKRRSGRRRR